MDLDGNLWINFNSIAVVNRDKQHKLCHCLNIYISNYCMLYVKLYSEDWITL